MVFDYLFFVLLKANGERKVYIDVRYEQVQLKQTNYEKQHYHSTRKHNVQHEKH